MKKVLVKAQRNTTFDPNVKSKYAKKMAQQAKGKFSPTSPFVPVKDKEESK